MVKSGSVVGSGMTFRGVTPWLTPPNARDTHPRRQSQHPKVRAIRACLGRVRHAAPVVVSVDIDNLVARDPARATDRSAIELADKGTRPTHRSRAGHTPGAITAANVPRHHGQNPFVLLLVLVADPRSDLKSAVEEHWEILQALRARNAQRAEKAVRAHLQNGLRYRIEALHSAR